MNRHETGFIKICIVALIAIILSGCIESAVSAKRQYLLEASRPDSESVLPGKGVVKVRRFRVASAFEGNSLVYRTGKVDFESDFYNEFLSSPGSVITEQARRWLGGSGIFTNVVDTGSRLSSDFVLEANVNALYGDFTSKSEPKAVLEIQFFLINTSGAVSKIAFSKTYKATKPLESRKPAVLVSGLNICIENILQAFEDDLQQLLK